MGWKTNGFACFYHFHGENNITIHLFKFKVFVQNLRSIFTRQTITRSRITECSRTRSWTSSIGYVAEHTWLFLLSLLPTVSINISVWMMWNISKFSSSQRDIRCINQPLRVFNPEQATKEEANKNLNKVSTLRFLDDLFSLSVFCRGICEAGNLVRGWVIIW